MKSHFYHLQININYSNAPFYKDLMTFLGWSVIFEGDKVVGYQSEGTGSLWFLDSKNKEQNDYDKIGVNHISIRVEDQKNVDEVASFLKSKNIPALFETPRHRPEFTTEPNETYYQVMFESPDKVLFEVVYVGPKA